MFLQGGDAAATPAWSEWHKYKSIGPIQAMSLKLPLSLSLSLGVDRPLIAQTENKLIENKCVTF